MNPKAQQILMFIEEFRRNRGFSPTIREIGKAVNLQSSCSVHYYLKKLEKNGLIRRDPAKPRTIEVLPHPCHPEVNTGVRMVPLLRELNLNDGHACLNRVESYVPLPRESLGDGQYFILRWKGSACPDIAVAPGDYLVCQLFEQAVQLQSSDLVIALTEEEILIGQVLEVGGISMLSCSDYKNQFTQLINRFQTGGLIIGIWKSLLN